MTKYFSFLLFLLSTICRADNFTNISTENTTDDDVSFKNGGNVSTTTELPTTPVPPLVFKPEDWLRECQECLCDKSEECDVNCCCDEDCSLDDKVVFRTCTNFISIINERKCFLSDPLTKINANTSLIHYTPDDLFCVVPDKAKICCYLDFVPLSSHNLFKIVRKHRRYNGDFQSGRKYKESFDHQLNLKYSRKWKRGQAILTLHSSKEYFILGLPPTDLTKSCSKAGPFLYLIDTDISCEYVINSKESCEENPYLNMETYNSDVLIILNSTSNLTISTQVCDKNLDECSNITNFRPPSYNEDTEICENSITSAKFIFSHRGTHGLINVTVKLMVGNVKKGFVEQKIKVTFEWAQTASSVSRGLKKSGNPGYLIGLPVIAGILINDSISSFDYLMFPTSSKDLCPLSGVINFGENSVYDCVVSVNMKLDDNCEFFRNKTEQLKHYSFNAIGSFGDLDIKNINNWIPIHFSEIYTEPNISINSSGNKICSNVSLSNHLEIRYILTGHKALPQHKVVGVDFVSINSDYNFVCFGVKKCGLKSQKINVRFAVTFVNVTK